MLPVLLPELGVDLEDLVGSALVLRIDILLGENFVCRELLGIVGDKRERLVRIDIVVNEVVEHAAHLIAKLLGGLHIASLLDDAIDKVAVNALLGEESLDVFLGLGELVAGVCVLNH